MRKKDKKDTERHSDRITETKRQKDNNIQYKRE